MYRLLESLKDYISKSLIKTVDHLGSVTDKVNKFLYEYVDEASRTKLRVLRFEQVIKCILSYYTLDYKIEKFITPSIIKGKSVITH